MEACDPEDVDKDKVVNDSTLPEIKGKRSRDYILSKITEND